jgi:hypothetical protein
MEAALPIDIEALLTEGRAAAEMRLLADFRERSRIIGRLRELAAITAAVPADRQEAEARARSLARRLLQRVRGDYVAKPVRRAAPGRR